MFDFLKYSQKDLLNEQLRKVAYTDVYNAFKKDFKAESDFLNNTAIVARIAAKKTYQEALIARQDVRKSTEIEQGATNLSVANSGFDVNDGTPLDIKLQQGLEGSKLEQNVFMQGMTKVGQLDQVANNYSSKLKEIQQQYSFFSSYFNK